MKKLIIIALSLLAMSTLATADDSFKQLHIVREPNPNPNRPHLMHVVTLLPWTPTYYQNFKETKVIFKNENDCKSARDNATNTIDGQVLGKQVGYKVNNNTETRIRCEFSKFVWNDTKTDYESEYILVYKTAERLSTVDITNKSE